MRVAHGTITTFDVPGAGTGAGQGTVPQGINPAGVTGGYYVDGGGVAHGFARDPDGKITTVDAPGAGTGPGQGTFLLTPDPAGAFAGFSVDGNGVYHGVLWTGWPEHHELAEAGR
jgi:hypothetical protein